MERRRWVNPVVLMVAMFTVALVSFAVLAHGAVSTTGVAVSYTGDAATSAFSYPNYLFEAPDLVVTVTASGVTTSYALNAKPGFTFTGVADLYGAFPAGGTVTFQDVNGNLAPPSSGAAILVTRQTPKTQIVTFVANSALSAVVLEHAYDKLTLMAQEQALFQGLSNGSPVTGSGTQSAACTLGQWYQNSNSIAGSNFGWVCSTAGIAGTAVWSPFGLISQ